MPLGVQDLSHKPTSVLCDHVAVTPLVALEPSREPLLWELPARSKIALLKAQIDDAFQAIGRTSSAKSRTAAKPVVFAVWMMAAAVRPSSLS